MVRSFGPRLCRPFVEIAPLTQVDRAPLNGKIGRNRNAHVPFHGTSTEDDRYSGHGPTRFHGAIRIPITRPYSWARPLLPKGHRNFFRSSVRSRSTTQSRSSARTDPSAHKAHGVATAKIRSPRFTLHEIRGPSNSIWQQIRSRLFNACAASSRIQSARGKATDRPVTATSSPKRIPILFHRHTEQRFAALTARTQITKTDHPDDIPIKHTCESKHTCATYFESSPASRRIPWQPNTIRTTGHRTRCSIHGKKIIPDRPARNFRQIPNLSTGFNDLERGKDISCFPLPAPSEYKAFMKVHGKDNHDAQ